MLFYKYIHIPPIGKSNSEIILKLNLLNMYVFQQQDFSNLKNHQIDQRGIFYISNDEDLNYYQEFVDFSLFSEIFVLTTSFFQQQILTFRDSKSKYSHIKIFVMFDHRVHFEKHSQFSYFTNKIDDYNANKLIDYFCPDLAFTENKFLELESLEKKREILPLPFPIFNPDADEMTNFNSLGTRVHNTEYENPELSIIIPHYENILNLEIVLINLHEQLAKIESKVEIVIVDDGSANINFDLLIDISKNMNIQFLVMPRQKQRKMGDQSYRAGLARNFGVEYCLSEKILFLDCDILVDSFLITKIRSLLKVDSILMPQRYQLKNGSRKIYSGLDLENDVDSTATPYWTDFYTTTKNWDDIPDKWKYVSTYCLAMTKNLFYKIGPFSNSFVAYGCEDVHFGYKAYLEKIQFCLTEDRVYHLQPRQLRSEFNFDINQRRALLRRAYFVLYKLQFSEEILRTLIYPAIKLVKND